MRIIKRYSNRKLYDTHESRYVTLLQLGDLIKQGETIKVDSCGHHGQPSEDITVQTLAQVLFEQQKRQPTLTASEFVDIIRKGARAFPNRV